MYLHFIFWISAYQDVEVETILEKGDDGVAITARKRSAEKSAEDITKILTDCGKKAFEFAARKMKSNGVKYTMANVEDDMYDRAALMHSKIIMKGDNAAYLQEK